MQSPQQVELAALQEQESASTYHLLQHPKLQLQSDLSRSLTYLKRQASQLGLAADPYG